MNAQQTCNTPIDDGGPVQSTSVEHGYNSGLPGLTKREHFAGLAMQSLLLRPDFAETHISVLAVNACEMADAQLAALKAER